jgi:hypothetical protein
MSASKDRLQWTQLPLPVRAEVERLVAGRVTGARSCQGGFSPGLAAKLSLADGRRVFVKALDGQAWPTQAPWHRAEARVAAVLPAAVPAPRLLGSLDDGRWVVLAFECVDGAEPAQPWRPADLDRAVSAVAGLARAMTPSPVELARDHPRLGGWASLAADSGREASLAARWRWAARSLPLLVEFEQLGLSAARGGTLVHFDMYAHNMLFTAGPVLFVDWPHARLGAPFIDLVMLLASGASDGIDPEPILRRQPLLTGPGADVIDAVLAAHAGYLVDGAMCDPLPGLEPVRAAKLALARGALGWLRRRLSRRWP